MKLYLIFTTILFLIGGLFVHGHLEYIDNQNREIITNQRQLILLLSKDYPQLRIQKVKRKAIKNEKLTTLEDNLKKLIKD